MEKKKSSCGKLSSRENSNVHCFPEFLFGKDNLILTASAYFEFNQMAEIPFLFITPLRTAPFMGGDQAL